MTAATWAVLMALSPFLQIREIRRRRTSAGVSVAYAVLVMALTIGVVRRYR